MTDSHPELNGSGPLPQPTDAELTGAAVADRLGPVVVRLGEVFMQGMNVMPQIMAQAVQQGRQRLWCLPCLAARIGWNTAHAGDLEVAAGKAAEAAGVPQGDPRLAQIDPTPFLPPELRPGSGTAQAMPVVNEGATMAGGNLVCPQHLPGMEAQAGRKQFLIAHGHLTPGMLAGLG